MLATQMVTAVPSGSPWCLRFSSLRLCFLHKRPVLRGIRPREWDFFIMLDTTEQADYGQLLRPSEETARWTIAKHDPFLAVWIVHDSTLLCVEDHCGALGQIISGPR